MGEDNNSQKLPDVNEAIELSIRLQKAREEKQNSPSWNIADEDGNLMELMNEGAEDIYKDKR